MPFFPDLNAMRALRPSSIFTANRIFLYAVFSTFAVVATVLSTFKNHSNFYSVAVHLSRSNRSVLVLANFSILLSLGMGRLMQQLFFGSLRAIEIERLYDRMWFFLTESLLAFTIFRDEFDTAFGLMFGFLLFVKCFHWLMADRIESMDQVPYPGPGPLFHIRIVALFTLLWFTDLIMLAYATETILAHGIGGIVLFGSEYAILMASAANAVCKYLVYAYDQRRAGFNGGENAPVWENKSMWIFYIELATDFMKLITYLTFFMLVLTFYGLPLNIIRDVYITGRSFYQRARDLVRYRAATKNMDERYPDVTEAEMNQTSDKTCIICREEMTLRSGARAPAAEPGQNRDGPNDTPKKLPCGHFFHFHCLRSWLERQQNCPTCRRSVMDIPEQQTRPAPPQEAAAPQPPGAPAAAPVPQLPLNDPQTAEAIFRRMWDNMGANPGAPPPAGGAGAGAGGAPPYQWRFDAAQGPSRRPQQQPPTGGAGQSANAEQWQWWTDNPGQPEAAQPPAQPPTKPPTATTPESSTTTDGQTSTPSTENERLTPRESAALAALRRMNSSQNSSTPTSPANPSPPSVPAASSTATPLLSPQQIPATPQRPLPQLIPLFDPSIAVASRMAPTVWSNVGAAVNTPTRTSGAPLSPFSPSSISAVDAITREAIDERLRVLDGVQDALWRCAEELLKIKSVLPSTPSFQQPEAPPPPVERQSEKGKEKDTSEAPNSEVPSTSSTPDEQVNDSGSLQPQL